MVVEEKANVKKEKENNDELAKLYKKQVLINADVMKNLNKYLEENVELANHVEDLEKIPVALAQQLGKYDQGISQIQQSAKIISGDAQKRLEEAEKMVQQQVEMLKQSAAGHVQAEQYIKQCKEVLDSVSALYQQSNVALKSTVEAQQRINQAYTTWKAPEILASQQQLSQVLSKLDNTLQSAYKELDKKEESIPHHIHNLIEVHNQ